MRFAIGWLAAGWLFGIVAGCGGADRASAGSLDDGSAGTAGSFANAGQGGRELTAQAGRGGAGTGGFECERELRFMAVELSELPPFDVIIVADHSDSLSWSRDDLAAGLSTLLSEVHGHTARFFVLTPTQYGATTPEAIHPGRGEDLVLWRDPVSGEPFEHAMTGYTQTCTDPGGAVIDCPAYDPTQQRPLFHFEAAFHFLMPEPVAAITPDMSDAEILAQQQAVSDAILSLGGSGSPREQPLCTLNRYVLQDPAQLPARAVFVVLSDEDDTTPPEECLAGFEYDSHLIERAHGTRCDTDCDTYMYFAYRNDLTQHIQFTCVPVDDQGTPHPEIGFPGAALLPTSASPDCVAVSGAGPCGSGGLHWAEQECGVGHVVQNCSSTCELMRRNDCVLETPEEMPDLCSAAFTHDGTAYANFFDYCDASVGDSAWFECQRFGYVAANVPSSTERPIPLVQARTAQEMIASFESAATRAFGAGGFQVEVIGFDPAFACEPGPGQSHATVLRELATSPADVFPICGDYAQALDGVSRFAQRLLETDLHLDLRSTETIGSVSVLDEGGVERVLPASSYRYDPATGMLHIDSTALTPADVGLSVEVDDSCANAVD